jgi:hypothetical protein
MPTPEEVVHGWWAEQPHPQAPDIKVGDYPTAARLATSLKFGSGHASPQEVSAFWKEFQGMNQMLQAQNKLPISPEEFTHLSKQMARSSFAYHGRPPSMYEINKLRDADPKSIHDYFGSLPDEHYPTVTAAQMAQALHSARPWANMISGGEPSKLDAAYLVHSGQNPRDYYQARDADQNRAQSQPGTVGPTAVGGQPSGQRTSDTGLATGAAVAGRQNGLSER